MTASLLRYCAGYGVFVLVTFALLLMERAGDSWSGNDPINKTLLIPCIFLMNIAIFILLQYLLQKRSSAMSATCAFAGGLIGGASLLALPRITAGLVSGWEVLWLLGCSLGGAGIAYLGARRVARGPPTH